MAGTGATAEVQTPQVVVESPNEAYAREVDAFLKLIEDKQAERAAAFARRDADPEGWRAAKNEFAEWRTAMRQFNPERAARDNVARKAMLLRRIAMAEAELQEMI